VRAAFRAAAERFAGLRRLAAERACRESAEREAAPWPSRFNAAPIARLRRFDGGRFAGAP
jgi:hypothetical protein